MTARRAGGALDTSLCETWAFFRRTQPEELEDALLQKAIHASLLDFAVTLRDESKAQRQSPLQDPAAVLGVPEGASVHTIRHAYRKRALKAHPDRGGDAEAFVSLQRAYRALLAASGEDPERSPSEHANLAITHQEKPADAIDLQLREHRQLVESWFQRDGVDLSARAQALQAAIDSLELEVRELGATNRNEQGLLMHNQERARHSHAQPVFLSLPRTCLPVFG